MHIIFRFKKIYCSSNWR